ncbi:hypothetical protein J1N35_040237 [Gossypium stocksii]|uniref:Aminotransferase-like plant mobile domain-containing protein n=1 Tax=Gossypium stocksii TaxID=47602 RepID=A0A9D3UD63_9ROSI|nr:hypothetical protein J1N35_040237 [Gossypium stocksii]
MAISLICLDEKHILGVQLQMAEEWILETYIHNLTARAPCVIKQHLQKAGFLHVSRKLGGTKLGLALINALVETWKLETHTFHLPCDECTITLEDVALQLELPIDGPVVMEAVGVRNYYKRCQTSLLVAE